MSDKFVLPGPLLMRIDALLPPHAASLRLRVALLSLVFLTVGEAAPLRVGVETDLEPITFVGPRGAPIGFAIDLVDGIAREMQLEVIYVMKPRTEMFADFYAGRVDALAHVVHTKERESTMALSVSYLAFNSAVFVRKGDKSIKTIDDLRTHRLAGIPNTRGIEYLHAQGLDTHFIPVPTQRDGLRAVSEGRADASVSTRLLGWKLLRDDRIANVEDCDIALPGLSYRYHVALHPGDAARLALLNEGLVRLRANGTYDKIYEKWIGPLEPRHLSFKDLEPYLLPVAIVLGAVLIALFWQRRLLRRLSRQAHALRASEERLTRVLDGSNDAFWDWDLRTGHVLRSDRWALMLGYAPSEIPPSLEAGRRLLHPDDVAIWDNSQLPLNEGRDRYALEYRLRAKSGEWRWILDRGKVIARGPHGEPLRMAGTHTDISERKIAEAALAESQALLKRSAQLLEQTQAVAHIGGWEVDVRNDRLYWTGETYRLHDTTPEAYQPTLASSIEFYAPESRPLIRAAIENAIRRGTPYELELDLITARQRRLRVRTTGHAEFDRDRVVKIYGSFRDITAEKTAESERESLRLKMLETQKLESLGVLAGGIAHDFNNLLNVILTNATFARSERAVVASCLAQIETAARRAADLCHQMLAYAGRGNFVIERVDLSQLVRDTAHLLTASVSKKAHFLLSLAPDLPAVEGDISQLRQVVMNLVINASEALGDATGEIRLITRRGRPEPGPGDIVHAFDLPARDCVCLEVVDTGCGMEAATLVHIFDPFFTTKFAGRGLGLAAVIGIVRTHRGALTVASTPGRGTTFRIFLPDAPPAFPAAAPAGSAPDATPIEVASPLPTAPANAPAAATPPEAVAAAASPPAPLATPPAPVDGVTILVADDEPNILATTDALLTFQGYRTVLATDGQEAVRCFEAQPFGFGAVLLDLTMPGLDGAEVLRAMRALNPAVRVMLMSGFGDHEILQRLRGQAPVPVLRKPFTHDALLTQLAKLVKG
jgi:two-component system, cell cycle sensor histidine kinase and response regulator CckA